MQELALRAALVRSGAGPHDARDALGAHGGQPTVISRVPFTSRKVNAWIICALRLTDRDLESVSASFSVNAWICPRWATDRDLESFSASFSVNAWICPRPGNRP